MRYTHEEHHKAAIVQVCVLCGAFFLWTLCNRMMLILPPMIGLVFVVFVHMRQHLSNVLGVLCCLMIFEVENQLPLGILALVFLIIRYVITEKMSHLLGSEIWLVMVYVGGIYAGYIAMLFALGAFGVDVAFSVHIIFIWYVLCEGVISMIYELYRRSKS